MKELTHFILITILIALQSCENKAKISSQEKYNWDFTSKEFKDKNVRLLSGYDAFEFKRQSDSIIIFDGGIFKDWKSEWLKVNDTLKLTETYFLKDSLGERTKQILSYSKKNQTYFQLIITKKELSSVDEMGQPKPRIWFDYEGKLFINKKNIQYFSDFLYTK